nr:hypothetical protein [Tanacetum cinerariifolium]
MTLKKLMDLYTTLFKKVLNLEKYKTAQAKEIASLKKRVTKLEQRQSSRILGFHPFRAGTPKRHSLGRRKVSKQGWKNLKSQQKFQDIDDLVDEGMNFFLDEDAGKTEEVNLHADTKVIVEDMGSGEEGGSTAEIVSTARPDISAARKEVCTAKPKTPPTTTTTLFDDEDVTIDDTLVKMKNEKANEKGVTFKDTDNSARPIRSIKTLQPLPTINLKDKGSEEDKKRIRNRKKRAAGLSSKRNSPKKENVNDQESKDSDKELKKCDVHMYKLTRLDGSCRHFSTFSRMLEVLDRQYVLDLNKIVMEKFPDSDPEEKRYHLTKEILKKMLSWRLEVETESTLALDLIKFIKLQIEEK